MIKGCDGNIIPKNLKFLETECESYELYKFVGKAKTISKAPKTLVEAATGRRLLSYDQLAYDTDFVKVETPKERENLLEACYESTLLGDNGIKVPVMVNCFIENVMFYQDNDGYFVENISNGFRSKSVDSIDKITDSVVSYISSGQL